MGHHPQPQAVARGRSLGAVIVAVMALLGSALLHVAAPTTAAAATTPISEGTFTWGIKESWRSYIGDGSVAGGGATVTETIGTPSNPYPRSFEFPITSGSFDDETNTTRLTLGGWVHFRKFPNFNGDGKWALDTKYSELTVEISPTSQVIRGNHTGYSREDPGGELHEDVDVVLARFDITGAETDFSDGRSRWNEIPTVAGPGLNIYSASLPIDPASIDYAGPGGLPDLAEKWDTPGTPTLAQGATWISTDATNSVTRTNRQLYVPETGPVVHTVEMTGGGTAAGTLTLTARDAVTLAPVGTPHVVTNYPVANRGQYAKTAFDAASGTVFFVTGMDGSPAVETTVRAARWDAESQSYQASVVGRLRDAVSATTQVPVEAMVWNPVKDELAAITTKSAAVDVYTNAEITRFRLDGGQWSATRSDLSAPATGEFAGASAGNTLFANHASSAVNDQKPLAVAADGSYLHASGSSYLTVAGARRYLPATHIDFTPAGAATVQYIDGTRPGTVSGTYYGFNSIVADAQGRLVLHNSSTTIDSYVRVSVLDGVATAGTIRQGPVDVFPPLGASNFATSMIADAEHDLEWVIDITDPDGTRIFGLRDDEILSRHTFKDFAPNYITYPVLGLGDNGAVYVPVIDAATNRAGYQRLELLELADLEEQPESVAVTLGVGVASKPVTFTSTVTGGSPAPQRQWQIKRRGESSFQDLDGEHGETLSVQAVPDLGGSQYRAVYASTAGRIVSDVADLSVDHAPALIRDAADQSVTEGEDATVLIDASGAPEPTITWQRRVGGYWQSIDPEDDNFTLNGASLTVRATNLEQSGSRFRAKVANAVATIYSRTSTLSVRPAVTPPEETLSLSGVALEWTGSAELQKAPPVGGSNYFSAGTSAGDEASYRASQGDVRVLQVAGDGSRTPATWATRAAHVASGTTQLIRLDGGEATVEPDGSATVSWDGAWSVNFYGGMVPFTLTDPELIVSADGTGSLRADLSGYASNQANPNDRTPLDPVADVTVAIFKQVAIDTTGAIQIEPDYAGVELEVPSGSTPQNRSNAGWGAWPQPFVDFHFASGLSSYWYSSGGAADGLKAPSAFTVDFTDAVETPEPGSERVSTTTLSLDRSRYAYGQSSTATIRVSAAGATPTGRVTVRVGSLTRSATLQDGAARVALPPRIAPGASTVVVTYPGADGVTGSSARTGIRVLRASPTVRATLKRASVKASQRARLKVRVALPGDAALPVTGQVVVRERGRIIAVGRLRASHHGVLTVRLPRLARGTHYLRASIGATELNLARSSKYQRLVVR